MVEEMLVQSDEARKTRPAAKVEDPAGRRNPVTPAASPTAGSSVMDDQRLFDPFAGATPEPSMTRTWDSAHGRRVRACEAIFSNEPPALRRDDEHDAGRQNRGTPDYGEGTEN